MVWPDPEFSSKSMPVVPEVISGDIISTSESQAPSESPWFKWVWRALAEISIVFVIPLFPRPVTWHIITFPSSFTEITKIEVVVVLSAVSVAVTVKL